MADIEFLSRFKWFNPETNDLILSLEFITPELLKLIEQSCQEKLKTRVKASGRFKEMKTYGDQKAWYGSIKLILRALEIPITAEFMELYDEEMRRNIFPTKKVILGGREIIKPLRMKEQTHEQMQRNIEILQQRHEYLNIDFSRFDG